MIDIKRFDSLIDSYVEGFVRGHDNFINSIKEKQVFFGNHEEQSNFILKRVLRPDLQKKGKFEYEEYFLEEPAHECDRDSNSLFKPLSFRDAKIIFDDQKFYECGKGGGEYFKAWEVIFENPEIFNYHFENLKILGKSKENSLVYEKKLNLVFDIDNNGMELDVNHPCYNSNFDLISFRLFMFMLEEYENTYKNKYANIFIVLKEFSKEGKYHFRFTREKFKKYLLDNFKIELTKIEKSEYKFDVERITLLQIESKFRTNNYK